MREIDNVPVWGVPLDSAVEQMVTCAGEAEYMALMADHHLGYSVPIGGVLAYDNKVSPSAVGFDI
ncbi:MAG: RtcB family protein, partial [Candidatus Latescibacterota bacterium]